MGRFVVSMLDKAGMHQRSAEFASHEAAKDFVEWRIEELLAQGTAYVVVTDKGAHTETRYAASSIADCVFVGASWIGATRC